ncbi:MAG: type II secretion system protein [Candidatus Daviesbacteria bacterium]|nr:type II secretion system protein [Candidatus Daviesbacteria bacterium]
MTKSARGFTLVELLVVISIIAILSAIGLVIFSGAQKSGRTAKRIGDLKAIQTALEVYYSRNGSYPTTGEATGKGVNCANGQWGGAWVSECSLWGSKASDQVVPGLVPSYIVAFPQDPQMDKVASKSCYLYTSDGTDYKLLDHIVSEFTAADYQSQKNLVDPMRPTWAWAVYTDGGRCW